MDWTSAKTATVGLKTYSGINLIYIRIVECVTDGCCLWLQVTELEAEFEQLGNEKPIQTRFLRSQQELKAKIEATAEAAEAGNCC